MVFLADTAASSGTTERVSVDSVGNESNNDSEMAAVSADGRYVAFSSFASNLVAWDTNGHMDIFVHDRAGAPVGGIAELPVLAETSEQRAAGRADAHGWSAGNYAALAGGFAAAAVLITVGGRYARRRWFGPRA
jgi:hypothetical protein